MSSKVPSSEERELFDTVMAIMEGKGYSSLIVFVEEETAEPLVLCQTDFEEGLDLATYAAVYLTERRRQVQYPEEYKDESDPGDETD